MKYVTLFFDVEAWWENPHRQDFDNKKAMTEIKKVLDKYNVKAVFNILGKVVESNPDQVKELHQQGHEIASHGYCHENFFQLKEEELDLVLEKTDQIIKKVIGQKPIGIRAPWLLVNGEVYDLFNERKYLWTSNKRLLHVEQIYNPSSSYRAFYDKLAAKSFLTLKFWAYKKKPFKIGNILEIPLFSSMDGELLGLIDPNQKSPKEWLDYAFNSWVSQFKKSQTYFNLNLHDWLIGTVNRPGLLDRILDYISKQKDIKFILARDLTKKTFN